MELLTIALIGLGLSMDAFAVSVTNGMIIKNLKPVHALKIAVFFGGFQALMPLLGWAIGLQFKDYIVSIDHWAAFVLLSFIGIKMIREAFEQKKQETHDSQTNEKVLNNKNLIILAIATSIDALAVGVGFAFLHISILQSILMIGMITLICCFIGVYIGRQFGGLLKKYAEIAGGIILILIGLKILAEHLKIIQG